MYSERFNTLAKAYSRAEENNKAYTEAMQKQCLLQSQLEFIIGLHENVKAFCLAETEKESEWRDSILGILSSQIARDLAFVYPTDGYQVSLSTRVLRGKIHVEARVTSTFAKDFPGKIKGTQGRLFQQVVSFSSLLGVMDMLGVKTVYIDEAFSGSAKKNVEKLNQLLASFEERGFNLVIIAQDITMADALPANRMFLSRTIDNKTIIQQEKGDCRV